MLPTVDTAAMVGKSVACLRAKSVLASTSAAPPSLVAQICIRRSGSDTTGDASTSSTVNTFL